MEKGIKTMNSVSTKRVSQKMSLPPGPRERYPFENLVALQRDPLAYLDNLARSYGDLIHFRLGHIHAFLLNHPQIIKQVWVSQHRDLQLGLPHRRARLVLGDGLTTSDGELHLRQRRLIQPAFHQTRLAHYVARTAEETSRWCDARAEGEHINLPDEFGRLALTITANALFGLHDRDNLFALRTAMEEMSMFITPFTLYFAEYLLKLPLPATRRFDAARARADAIISQFIAEHQSASDGHDMLTMLLHPADDATIPAQNNQVRDELISLLNAAHGTTALVLTWVFYLLWQFPEARAKLEDELDTVLGQRRVTVSDLENLPYTRALVAETMRLYPPVWAMDREVVHPIQVGDYVLPKGALVLVRQWVSHRDARFFPEPSRFMPERWLQQGDVLDANAGYLPFGIGPRVCPGEQMAWMNLMLLLATIARRWRLDLEEGQRLEIVARSGLGFKGKIMMIVRSRQAPTEII